MVAKLSDSSNVGILVFLVMLGILVALMNKAGGSAAFGRWASTVSYTHLVGALCSSSSRVPTVPQPSSSAAATLIQQVFSASATSAGVANTSDVYKRQGSAWG